MVTINQVLCSRNTLPYILNRTRARRTGRDKWQGHCPNPIHRRGDRNPSLSLKLSGDRILLYCHSCHDTPAICAALRIPISALMGDGRPPHPPRVITDWKVELRRTIPRLARAVVEDPPPDPLRAQWREVATLYRWSHRHIDILAAAGNHAALGDAIALHLGLERELDDLERRLCHEDRY